VCSVRMMVMLMMKVMIIVVMLVAQNLIDRQ